MKRLNALTIRFVLTGIVAAVAMSGASAKADYAFDAPTNLGPTINSTAVDCDPEISADGLTLYFASSQPGGNDDNDLWMTMRQAQDEPWGPAANLGPTINSPADDRGISLSADGLELYFISNRTRGYGGYDIWVTKRASTDQDWGQPANLGSMVNSSTDETDPVILADGLSLYFASERPGGEGGMDVYFATRATKSDDWGTPERSGPTLNSPCNDRPSCMSADCLVIFFHSDRPGGCGGDDLYVARRETVLFPWARCVNLGPMINSAAADCAPSISADGSTLYFSSDRPGGVGELNADIYQAPIVPIVDLNGDGIVDRADLRAVVDHWGEYYPLCDIGPLPWGDDIVDLEDIIVLTEHMSETVDDPTLIAHWKLDEAKGDIAYDSAGSNDGILYGHPLWQPGDGQIDGALAFDGIGDYVGTNLVLDPGSGPFGMVVWVKGGAPGQVIVSQTGGPNWLCTDPFGNLMTEVKSPRWDGEPLFSPASITDGQWHRVGLAWYHCRRSLYVDGVEVAKDTKLQSSWQSAYGGLCLGAGTTLEVGSYFSGLIDDVRIYDRALAP